MNFFKNIYSNFKKCWVFFLNILISKEMFRETLWPFYYICLHLPDVTAGIRNNIDKLHLFGTILPQ